jgi:hypothetical protein
MHLTLIKNKPMKNILLIIFIVIVALSFGQGTTVINESPEKEKKKISYSFINEYGFGIGRSFEYGYLWWETVGVFVNGIRFNKTQDEIGIGVGSEYMLFLSQSFPIFLNYRHYFPSKKDIKPLINIGVGTRLNFYRGHEPWQDRKLHCFPGLYSTVAIGFKVKAFSFTSGGFLKSWGDSFYSGGEIKMGFTF